MTEIVPAEQVSAAPLELGRLAAARYGFGADARLHLFPLTENWTFRVEEGGGPAPVVLRIYRPNGKSLDEIRSELGWIGALTADGFPVPPVVPTLDGADVFPLVLDSRQSPLYCCAFEAVPGTEPAPDELPTWFPRLGELTARLHRHARSWRRPDWFTRPRWDFHTTLGERPHWGRWEASVPDPEEQRQLRRLDEVVRARLARFGEGPARFGLIHADLRLANLIVEGERLAVVDFDDCGESWFLYDLAATLTFNEGRPDVDELIDAWVGAYRRLEPLSREDEAEIRTFLMLRRLLISAYVGIRPDTELARELREAGYSTESCVLAERYLSRYTA